MLIIVVNNVHECKTIPKYRSDKRYYDAIDVKETLYINTVHRRPLSRISRL